VQALLASLATHVEAWALEEPRALLDAGEWGMAFEALRYNLYEKDIPVFPGEVAEIESLGGGDEHPAPGLAADARASYRMVPRAHRLVAMRALDLFHDPRRRSYASMPEMDALTEPDALQEAALVDVRLSALDNSVGLLFDLRGALQLQDGDTAILIAREVARMSWDALSRSGRTWYATTRSVPDTSGDRFAFSLGLVPDARLTLEAAGAEFYVGAMAGVDGPPPDLVADDDATVLSGMPRWDAAFEPSAASFLDPSDAPAR
jgi:hypothetical protein